MPLPRIGFIGCGPFSTGSIYPCLQAFAYGLAGDAAIERVARGHPEATPASVGNVDNLGYAAELVACCDQKEELARRNARAFGFERYYTDYHKMLDQEDLDSVFVVMHPKNQPRIAMEVLRSGRNVYVEKPPATTLAEVREIKATADNAGKWCQVGFMKRFSEPFVRAKAISAQPGFGRLSVYESRKARYGSYYPEPIYHFLNGFVCHHLDLARFFMGEVDSVYADMVSRTAPDPTGANAALARRDDLFSNYYSILGELPGVRQADGYLILFRFASGAIGVHNANCLEENANVLERVTLTGESAVAVVEDWWTVKGYIHGREPSVWEPLHVDAGGPLGMLNWLGYLGEVREFIAATAERRPPTVTIDDGVKCLEIETAVRRSIADGRRVTIAEIRSA
jgi:predicted dehydrogenase